MTARDQVARLLAEHEPDMDVSRPTGVAIYDGCRCGWYPSDWSERGRVEDWLLRQAEHQVGALAAAAMLRPNRPKTPGEMTSQEFQDSLEAAARHEMERMERERGAP